MASLTVVAMMMKMMMNADDDDDDDDRAHADNDDEDVVDYEAVNENMYDSDDDCGKRMAMVHTCSTVCSVWAMP